MWRFSLHSSGAAITRGRDRRATGETPLDTRLPGGFDWVLTLIPSTLYPPICGVYTRGHPVLAGPVLVFQPLTLGEVTFEGLPLVTLLTEWLVALFITLAVTSQCRILRCVPRRNQSAGLTT